MVRRRCGEWAFLIACLVAVPLAATTAAPSSGGAAPPPARIMAAPATPACKLSPPPAPAEINELLDALDDHDYQTRVVACRHMKRKGPCWLGDGGGAPAEGACGDDARVLTLFGPETFVRTPGAPSLFHRIFAVTAEGEVCVKLENDGVAAAWIALDDTNLFSPSDFAPVVTEITATPELSVDVHALDVTLASTPGSSLSVEVRFLPVEDSAAIVEFFERALADPSQNVVREALVAAGDVPIIPVWEIARDVVQRERGNFSSVTLHVAIDAFVRMSRSLFPLQPGPVEALAAVLFNDRAASVRAAAAMGIAKLRTASGVEVLEAALAAETNPNVADAIRSALAQLRVAASADAATPVLPVAP